MLTAYGRAAHQGPEVDGDCRIELAVESGDAPARGDIVAGRVVDNDGADLHVELLPDRSGGGVV